MIYTNKYEGHTEGPWTIAWWEGTWYVDDENNGTVSELFGTAQKQYPTAKLIQDAPLLLAEIKRIQMDNTMLENNLKDTKHRFNRAIERCNETKEELSAEVKRLREKLFEAELWVNNNSYTFENNIKELNDYAEARMNE